MAIEFLHCTYHGLGQELGIERNVAVLESSLLTRSKSKEHRIYEDNESEEDIFGQSSEVGGRSKRTVSSRGLMEAAALLRHGSWQLSSGGLPGDIQVPALTNAANPEAVRISGPSFSGVTLTHGDTLCTDTSTTPRE